VRAWLDWCGSGCVPVTGSWERGNEPPVGISWPVEGL
jgi:hypothetical protein